MCRHRFIICSVKRLIILINGDEAGCGHHSVYVEQIPVSFVVQQGVRKRRGNVVSYLKLDPSTSSFCYFLLLKHLCYTETVQSQSLLSYNRCYSQTAVMAPGCVCVRARV